MFLVFWGYIFATLVRFNFVLEEADRWLGYKPIFGYLIVFLISSLIFKPYVGIIRYTHKEDILTVLKTILVVSFSLAVLNFYFREFFPPRVLIPHSVLIIVLFVNSGLLIGYRFVVKEFFDSAVSRVEGKIRVAIYGAGMTGRTAARIMTESGSRYALKFFVDDNPVLNQSTILGKKVFQPVNGLKGIPGIQEIDELIIAIQDLPITNRNLIIDDCLKLGIQIKEVPNPNRWVGGHLSERQFRDIRIEDLLGRNPITLASTHVINVFSGKTIWVTGAAGSIGSEICKQLMKCGVDKLVVIDKAESDLYDLQQSLLQDFGNSGNVECIIGDVTHPEKMKRLFGALRPHIVFHAAAYKHVPMMESQPIEAMEVNVLGTKILADLSVDHDVEKFIMISTDKAVNPTNIMGASKRAAEMYIQSLNDISKVKFITTRFGNVLGSKGSVIPLITNQIKKGGPVTITHPEITRFFMTIPEACSLVLEAGAMGKEGEVFVFDMGEPIKIVDLVNKMIRLSGLEPSRDIEVKFIGLRPGEKLYEEVLFEQEDLIETHHPKIKIAKVSGGDSASIKEKIELMGHHCHEIDELSAVSSLKDLVPEFKSQMSKFEILD